MHFIRLINGALSEGGASIEELKRIMATFRELSRKDWGRSEDGTIEELAVGSLQRIADATEVMAKQYNALIADRDYFKGRYASEKELAEKLERKVRLLNRSITRLKKA